MRYIKLIGLLMLFVSAGLFVTSCKSDGSRRVTGEISDEEAGEVFDQIEQMTNVYHLCPSPAEMLSIINVDNMQFNGDILNPPQNIDIYLDTRSQTLNLGVYITDMAYASLFGRNEETIDYLEIVREIAEKIRVSDAIKQGLIDRAKQNVGFIDSLFVLSNEAFINMLLFCEKNSRPNTIILISAGAFIESLYLAIQMIEQYDPSSYLIQHLAEQKYVLDNLLTSAAKIVDDPHVSVTIEMLMALNKIYNQLETTDGVTTVKKESDDKLVIGGGKKILISEKEFEQLKETALQIRYNIISTEV